MRKSLPLLATSLLIACSGGTEKPDDKPTEGSTAGVLAECQHAADAAKEQAETFRNLTTGSRDSMEAAYLDFQRVVTSWEAEDAPCAREGASVTDRMTIQQETAAALAEAESEGTRKILDHVAGDIDEAREILKTIFATGRTPSDAVLDAAVDIDRRYRQRLLKKFQEHGKYGQLDEKLETTCIFGTGPIDPNAEEITDNFKSVFEGNVSVNALCRIAMPAEKFAGDPDGQIVIVLDDDDDPTNGVVHEGELGSPEKWKQTQWFSGRFDMPQGKYSKMDAGYYYVWIKADRPELGDEALVHNWFYWTR